VGEIIYVQKIDKYILKYTLYFDITAGDSKRGREHEEPREKDRENRDYMKI